MTSLAISFAIMIIVVGALGSWMSRRDRQRRERRTDAGHHQ
jgi:hypothetical protein